MMKNKVYFFPKKIGASFKEVALNCRGEFSIIVPPGVDIGRPSTYVPAASHVVINWGYKDKFPKFPDNPVKYTKVINRPIRVGATQAALNEMLPPPVAGNLDGCVGYSTSYADEEQTLFPNDDGFRGATVHRQYIPKSSEYRIHLTTTHGIIYKERKILRAHDDKGIAVDKSKINWRHRSRVNGFIYNPVTAIPIPVQDLVNDLRKMVTCDFVVLKILYSKNTNKATLWSVEFTPFLETRGQIETYSNYLKEVTQ